MIHLLYIDTSKLPTIGLSAHETVIYEHTGSDEMNHAAVINNMIADALTSTSLTFADLDGVAVCAGPGSYTGLRIGLSVAKALCYTLDIPLLLYNRLTLIAYGKYRSLEMQDGCVAALLKARDGEYFITVYDALFHAIAAPQHAYAQDIGAIIRQCARITLVTDLAKDEAERIIEKEKIVDNNINVQLNIWVEVAVKDYENGVFADIRLSEPFYLKEVYMHKKL
jgi:tRNA threonylcarbamoyladenosine biosynthesis protein TsaB